MKDQIVINQNSNHYKKGKYFGNFRTTKARNKGETYELPPQPPATKDNDDELQFWFGLRDGMTESNNKYKKSLEPKRQYTRHIKEKTPKPPQAVSEFKPNHQLIKKGNLETVPTSPPATAPEKKYPTATINGLRIEYDSESVEYKNGFFEGFKSTKDLLKRGSRLSELAVSEWENGFHTDYYCGFYFGMEMAKKEHIRKILHNVRYKNHTL